MSRYLWFETNKNRIVSDGTSGIKVTPGYSGWWMSLASYGPDDQDWWRSICGHTVDKIYPVCPVCGEKQMEEK